MTVTSVSEEITADRVLDAVGAAWSTYILYPNPVNQPGFQRAVESLAGFNGTGFIFDVGAGSFMLAGKPMPSSREGVERLAKQLFVRDVEAIRFVSPPTAEELAEFFRLVSLGDIGAESGGGIQRGLGDAGIMSIAVRQRGLLVDEPEEEGLADKAESLDPEKDGMRDRTSVLAAMVDDGAEPAEVLAYLIEEAGDEPGKMIDSFVVAYREIHDELVAEDLDTDRTVTELLHPYWEDSDPARTVRVFVDTYFLLPESAKAGVVNAFLSTADTEVSRLFLDQFSGAELAQLAPSLDEEAFARLIEYARDSAGLPGGMPKQIFALLQSAQDVKEARQVVIDRISELLSAPGLAIDQAAESLETLREEASAGYDSEGVAGDVLRALTECEERPDRFERVLRVWTGRIATELRERRFRAGMRLLEAVCTDPVFASDRQMSVDAALRRMLTPELLSLLIDSVTEDEEAPDRDGVIRLLGGAVVTALIEQLAAEEDAGRRRALIELLTNVGKSHFALLTKHLSDPRWYMVRNLAIILGKAGYARGVPALKRLLVHEDHRVRVESLRSLTMLLGEESTQVVLGALGDDHERVRQTAVGLLGASPASDVDAALGAAFLDGTVSPGEMERVAKALIDRGTAEGRAVLEKAASRSLALRPAQRAAKHAAKAALR